MRAYTASPQKQRKPEEDGDEEKLNQYPERRARGEARILAANVCYIVQGDFFGAYIIGSIGVGCFLCITYYVRWKLTNEKKKRNWKINTFVLLYVIYFRG